MADEFDNPEFYAFPGPFDQPEDDLFAEENILPDFWQDALESEIESQPIDARPVNNPVEDENRYDRIADLLEQDIQRPDQVPSTRPETFEPPQPPDRQDEPGTGPASQPPPLPEDEGRHRREYPLPEYRMHTGRTNATGSNGSMDFCHLHKTWVDESDCEQCEDFEPAPDPSGQDKECCRYSLFGPDES